MEHNNDGCIIENGWARHPYATKTCSKCGAIFCFSCCENTNIDQGGKHDPNFMNCPNCGNDYYKK